VGGLNAISETEIDAAYLMIAQLRAGALLMGADPLFTDRRCKNLDGGLNCAKFPVHFPVSREFGAETG